MNNYIHQSLLDATPHLHSVNIVSMHAPSSLTVVSGGCEVVLQSQLALCTLEDVLFHRPTTHQPQHRHIPACMHGGHTK